MIVTGAASGIGLEAALQLAKLGDHIVVADRNEAGGRTTVQRIVGSGGSAEFRELDLADLSAIRVFAQQELDCDKPLDVLINNAGLLPPMNRTETADGFELMFGICHLGHFALTGLLLPALLRSSSPRVVSVSSTSHSGGQIEFANLQSEREYASSRAYANTKLACLLFSLELQRCAVKAGSALISVGAHPGVSVTPIANGWKGEDRRRLRDRFDLFAYRAFIGLFAQTAQEGAQPLVYAASNAEIIGGGYYGPQGFKQMSGKAGKVQPAVQALNKEVAKQLWEESTRLTGVNFDLLNAR